MEEKKVSIPKITPPVPKTTPKIVLQQLGQQFLKREIISFPDLPSDEPDAYSYLGTPVFDNLTFEPGSYTVKGVNYNYEGLTINSVLLDVTMNKNIVKTAIQGRDGTVKEYISLGDYDVQLTGVLISQNENTRPIEDFNKLIKLCKVPTEIKVTSSFLKLFGIYYLVIDPQAQFPQREGERNTQYFRISAVSEEPIQLQRNA